MAERYPHVDIIWWINPVLPKENVSLSMDEIWFYLIAAVIYFITRIKKKKDPKPTTPNTANTSKPTQQQKPVSFDDLLKEITEQRQVPSQEPPKEVVDYPSSKPTASTPKSISSEGRNRQFADDESRRIYEESVRQAEGSDLDYAPEPDYAGGKLFKGDQEIEEEETIADEVRKGLQSTDTARKAIIYSEILSRKY